MTSDPAGRLGRVSLLGGSTNRALALLMLSSRLLHWLPVLTAVGMGSSGDQLSMARWYSGRGSRVISEDNYGNDMQCNKIQLKIYDSSTHASKYMLNSEYVISQEKVLCHFHH